MASASAAGKSVIDTGERAPLLPTTTTTAPPPITPASGTASSILGASILGHREWRLGLALAVISGLLHTATNFFVQYFGVNAVEVLLVRSVVQTLVLGIIAGTSERRLLPAGLVVGTFVLLQSFLGAFRLYFNFKCLAHLPLGDALTLIFTEPLFTILLSLVFLGVGIGPLKIILCSGLLAGMVLNIQPPFMFPNKDQDTSSSGGNSFSYYFGAALAVACAICGSLCNVCIFLCGDEVSSAGLVFYTGIGGIVIAIIGCYADDGDSGASRMLFSLESLSPTDWGVLLMISALGVLAYLAMTQALKLTSPTSVSVLRALEIILAYVCQIAVMGQYPNLISIGGAVLVIASVVGIAVEEKLADERFYQ